MYIAHAYRGWHGLKAVYIRTVHGCLRLGGLVTRVIAPISDPLADYLSESHIAESRHMRLLFPWFLLTVMTLRQ